ALTATAVSDVRIDLAWGYPGNNATGFVVERSTDGINFASVGTVADPAATGYSDTNSLDPATTYWYRVRATTAGANTPPSNAATATTQLLVPPAPTGLTAVPVAGSSTAVQLNWADRSGNETGFQVERSTDGKTFVQIFVTAPDATGYQ